MKPSELPDFQGRLVALDTETSGLHPDDGATVSTVSVAWIDDLGVTQAHAFPFDQGLRDKLPVSTLFQLDDPNLGGEEWEQLLRWLKDQRLVFHNAKFDLHMMRTGTRQYEGMDFERQFQWDTSLVQRLLDPTSGAKLKDVAQRYGLIDGNAADKQEVLKRHLAALKKEVHGKWTGDRYDLAEWDVMEPYARRDAELTILLAYRQTARVDEGEAPHTRIAFQHDLMRTLYRMEQRGIAFDTPRAMQGAQVLRRRLKAMEAKLPFPATLPGAKRYFFEERGVPIYSATPKGQARLDDEVSRKMVQDRVPWAKEWSEITDVQKALSMWYLGWSNLVGSDGRLRCTYKQQHVKTGRIAVERVQLQAIPKDDKAIDGVPPVKGLFRAKDGYRLWNLDISQAELRVASKMANAVLMLEMLEGGADIHGITTTEIFGITPGHPDFKVKRDIAKRLTFGGIFQIGAEKFQATLSKLAGIELALQECEQIVQRWRRMYPQFGQAYYAYMHQADRQGWIEILGRERSYFVPGRDYPNSAWSRRVQASLAKAAMMWLIQTEAQAPGTLVLTVHDSVVLELPEDDTWTAMEVAERGEKLLTGLFDIRLPIEVGPWSS